jgi:hypothetical protein
MNQGVFTRGVINPKEPVPGSGKQGEWLLGNAKIPKRGVKDVYDPFPSLFRVKCYTARPSRPAA